MSRIGVVGFGIMGSGMVRNLLAAGHDISLWNRTRRQLPDGFSKVAVAATIRDAVADKPIVLISLTGPDAQRDTLQGPDGVLATAQADALVIDTTSTDPHLSLELSRQAAVRGLRYLDAPVFGSRNEAWEGRLDFVCGGERAAFDEARPLLEAMAATTHYMGPSSKGAAAKLVGNLLVAAQMASLGEALGMAKKAGLEPEALMGMLDVTDFSSGLIRGVGRATLAGDFGPHFHLKNMLKDARLIGEFARSLAVSVPQAALTAELYQAALNKGLGEMNASALHKLQFENSGIE